MATAGELVQDSLAQNGYLAAETPVEAADLQRGIKTLNRMMIALEEGVVQLGYTPVSSSSDQLTVPDNSLEAIELMLAVKLAPVFSVPLDPLLIKNANEAYSVMLSANRPSISMQFPGNLPRGSGNDTDFIRSDKFYSNDGEPNF